MGRAEERARRKLEKNPARECNDIQHRFCPGLFNDFAGTEDPRHPSYVDYSNKVMLASLYYKGIAGIGSMQGMTYEFNKDAVVRNLYGFMGEEERGYLPHGVTLNEYFERLDPSELREVLNKQVYRLIRGKSFYDARFRKKWLVIVDGTRIYSGGIRLNDGCLESHYNKGTEKETVSYHSDVLEAKIVLGEKLLVSIASEFIENNGEDAERQKGMSEEEKKQDCERKAFKRLAGKLKKAFPRLPIILLADSLYASGMVMDICKENGWDYIIRYKTGSIPSITEEYENIPEKERAGNAEFVNDIDYNGRAVNMLRFHEERIEKGKEVHMEFQWLTDIRLTGKNAEKTAAAGRKRWKIENEGFNRQKHWQGEMLVHACSWDANAMKNHYLMQQISDMVKQLYEWFYLKKNGIGKKQKNISPELLESFGWPITGTEDIWKDGLLDRTVY